MMTDKEPQHSHSTPPTDDVKREHKSKSLWQVFFSAVAAAFGVQSDKNRQKDFSNSSPWPYIFAGLTFTLVFILVLVGVVNLVLS